MPHFIASKYGDRLAVLLYRLVQATNDLNLSKHVRKHLVVGFLQITTVFIVGKLQVYKIRLSV